MKTKITILISSVAALVLAACSGERTDESTATATTTEATPYPLDVCIVSGEKLGSMGEPITIIHEGREIKFCCDSCPPRFEEDPEKYLNKLDQ